MTSRRRSRLWGLFVLLALVGGLMTWSWRAGWMPQPISFTREAHQAAGSLETLGVYGEIPDFALLERSGRAITQSSLLGMVWIADVIYTQCDDTCPLQSAQMAALQAEFEQASDLRFVSVSIDPERDTQEALSRYAERYSAHPDRWLFLTGDKPTIVRLIQEGFRLGVMAPRVPHQAEGLLRWFLPQQAFATHGAQGLILHSSRFVLVDRQARIRAYHRPDEAASLARLGQNVRALLLEQPHG